MRKRLKRTWNAVQAFLGQDVWDTELSTLSGIRRRVVHGIRILHLVLHGFRADECRLHASALTFYTLMALVPVLALSLALARVFGGESIAREQVRQAIGRFTAELHEPAPAAEPVARTNGVIHATRPPHVTIDPERPAIPPTTDPAGPPSQVASEFALQIEQMVDDVFDQVARIDFTTLGGIGLVMLLWMVIGVLGRVEASFNRVWSINTERTVWRKFTDYLSVLLILPFLATAASSIPVVSLVAHHAGGAGDTVRNLLMAVWFRRLLVLLLTTLAFAFLLIFLPNTRVRWMPGLGGGLATAILFMIWLRICAALQIGVVRYSRIYGSFATVPILLAWVFVSWQIVLLGAELAYAIQNADTYRLEEGGRRASIRAHLMLALALTAECARGMRHGASLDAGAYARERRISARLLSEVLGELEQSGLLAKVNDRPGHFLMQRDPSRVTAGDVVRALLENGHAPESVGLQRLDKAIGDFDRTWFRGIEQQLNTPVGDLVTGTATA